MKFYLAAPFFNSTQVKLVETIEIMFADACVPLFSPRRQHGNKTTKITTVEQAKEVFKCNHENIDDATHMLAVVDWLLPEGSMIRELKQMCRNPLLEQGDTRAHETIVNSGPLNIPDAGTVWEMGYAFAKNIPVYMFTTRAPEDALNIMLTQSCQGAIFGLEFLAAFISDGQHGNLNHDAAPCWKGRLI